MLPPEAMEAARAAAGTVGAAREAAREAGA